MQINRILIILTIGMALSVLLKAQAQDWTNYYVMDTLGVCKDYEKAIIPPADAQPEQWEMIYDHFKGKFGGMLNATRKITVVKEHENYYLLGVFKRYPELWIKMVREEDGTYKIPFNSYLGYDNEMKKEILFNTCLTYSFNEGSGNTYTHGDAMFIPWEIPYRFTMDEDGRMLKASEETLIIDHGMIATYHMEGGLNWQCPIGGSKSLPPCDKVDKYTNVRFRIAENKTDLPHTR